MVGFGEGRLQPRLVEVPRDFTRHQCGPHSWASLLGQARPGLSSRNQVLHRGPCLRFPRLPPSSKPLWSSGTFASQALWGGRKDPDQLPPGNQPLNNPRGSLFGLFDRRSLRRNHCPRPLTPPGLVQPWLCSSTLDLSTLSLFTTPSDAHPSWSCFTEPIQCGPVLVLAIFS